MIDSLAIRNSPSGFRHVRHSNFDIRHCPAPHDATGRFDFVLPKAKEFVKRGAEVYATAQSCYEK